METRAGDPEGLRGSDEQGRYLLFLDILGFSQIVETKPADEIYAVIDQALSEFSRWEQLNKLFRTIYFSDTFLFYQESTGYARWAFMDIYAIGSMILSALLAKGIPARGAISFGEFEVRLDASTRHQVYFGKALVEAYKAEQREKWIGITVLTSAWEPFETENPGLINAFTRDKVWLKRDDNTLLLNPFIKLRAWHDLHLIGEVTKPYSKFDEPEFPNDILAFNFIRRRSDEYADLGDFSSPNAIKYHSTMRFLQVVLGDDICRWAVEAGLPENF